MSVLCSMVGASFQVAALAEVIRRKKGITAVGDAKVSTAQSQFGGASLLLDGTGDYLLISPTSEFVLRTNNWTAEMWIRPTTNQSSVLFDTRQQSGSGADNGICLFYSGTNLIYFTGNGSRITGPAFVLNTWQHIALVRNGNDHILYINGTQSGSTYTATNDITSTNVNSITIGTNSNSIGQIVFAGSMDEIRISNTARYTANFTPSTTAFVNDANTLLLIHANGTNASTFFEDDNGVRAPKGIVAYGNAQISTAQSKFGGASAAFDGTGDYLLTAPGSYDISGNFTMECWFYQNTTNTALKIFDGRGAASAQGGNGTLTLSDILMVDTAGGSVGGTYRIRFFVDGAERNSSPQSHSNSAWHHMAIVRSGTTFTFYVNGVSYGSYTQSPVKNYSSMLSDFFQSIGSTNGTGGFWNGWLEEFRISNSARYTANFTPSTTAFVNDANTLLLLHADGTNASTVFRDDNGVRSQKGITAFGNAQVSTAQSKFGGASAVFDGVGDYLQAGSTGDFLFPPGSDVTMELFFRIDTALTGEFNGLISMGSVRGSSSNEHNIFIMTNSSTGFNRRLQVGHNFNILIGSTTNLNLNQMYHVAVTRSSTTFTLWLDGVSQGTSTNTLTLGQNTGLKIGSLADGTLPFNKGHIDEVRVSNTARYTTTFTPSTTPFQNDGNTVLLMHADGTNASTVFIDDNGVIPTHQYT